MTFEFCAETIGVATAIVLFMALARLPLDVRVDVHFVTCILKNLDVMLTPTRSLTERCEVI